MEVGIRQPGIEAQPARHEPTAINLRWAVDRVASSLPSEASQPG